MQTSIHPFIHSAFPDDPPWPGTVPGSAEKRLRLLLSKRAQGPKTSATETDNICSLTKGSGDTEASEGNNHISLGAGLLSGGHTTPLAPTLNFCWHFPPRPQEPVTPQLGARKPPEHNRMPSLGDMHSTEQPSQQAWGWRGGACSWLPPGQGHPPALPVGIAHVAGLDTPDNSPSRPVGQSLHPLHSLEPHTCTSARTILGLVGPSPSGSHSFPSINQGGQPGGPLPSATAAPPLSWFMLLQPTWQGRDLPAKPQAWTFTNHRMAAVELHWFWTLGETLKTNVSLFTREKMPLACMGPGPSACSWSAPDLGQAVLDRHNHDTSVSSPSPQEDQSS